MLVVPQCQQRDCAELARNLPELVIEAAVTAYSQARVQVLSATDALQARWKSLVGSFGFLSVCRFCTLFIVAGRCLIASHTFASFALLGTCCSPPYLA